uniref:Uncharacterized protein n=1 Tax=Anguilla anguilla TaxID=7936 RepID=A0A0E9QLA4_ANGAN
MLVGIANSLTL